MNKKAYMFTVDVVIAIIILIIGAAIIFYKFTSGSRTVYITEHLSADIIGVLARTEIKDLCEPYPPAPAVCSCPNYPNLTAIVCDPNLKDKDTDLLSMMSEVIERGILPGEDVKDLIHEIFVDKNVIDDKRFGFAVLYWGNRYGLLELYNTECYYLPNKVCLQVT